MPVSFASVLFSWLFFYSFANMKEILIVTEADLKDIEHLAELRFTISQIATMKHLDVAAFRMAVTAGNTDIAEAYNAGKLRSVVARRESILKAANAGEEWAIKILDGYEVSQTEEELQP